MGFLLVVNECTCIGYPLILSSAFLFLAVIFTLVSNVCFGTSLVFYYAYLPLLVDANPRVRQAKRLLEEQVISTPLESIMTQDVVPIDSSKKSSSTSPDSTSPENSYFAVRDEVSNAVSSKGYIYAFCGALLALVLCGMALFFIRGLSQEYLMQVLVAGVGVWWLVILFAVSVPRLIERPGPPLPANERSFLAFSWKEMASTLGHAYKLPNTFLILVAWLFYSDGFSTIASVAVLFAKTNFYMSSQQILIMAFVTPLMTVAGTYFFLHVCFGYFKMSSKKILLLLIVLMLLIPLYGLIGFLTPNFGIQSVTEVYAVALYYGFLLGPLVCH